MVKKFIIILIIGIIAVVSVVTYLAYRQQREVEKTFIRFGTPFINTQNVPIQDNTNPDVVDDTQKKIGDSWVRGRYKYTVKERSGPFYVVSATDNSPECSNIDNITDFAACSGGWYYGKDGEIRTQSSSDSIDCKKIISMGFPKDFDSTISSCYNN